LLVPRREIVSIPPELSTLLLSAILIDTKGLKAGGKAVDVDREAAAYLIPLSHLARYEDVSALSDNQPITQHSSAQSLSATLGRKEVQRVPSQYTGLAAERLQRVYIHNACLRPCDAIFQDDMGRSRYGPTPSLQILCFIDIPA
jgi:hypothetical protein